MARFGIIEAIKSGLRFRTTDGSNYVGLKPPASAPATSFDLTLFNALPGSTQAITVDSTGQLATQALSGGGGTVTSVALALPNIFGVSGSPVTTTGTLTAAFNSQSANVFFASPDGSSGTPVFRAIAAADVPSLLASKISNFDTQVRTNRLDQLAAPTASVAFNSQKITGLADPTNAQDAATKAYVDAFSQGLDVKASCRVASTANVSVSSAPSAIDGVTLAAGNRILLKNQTAAAENGYYVFTSAGAALARTTDADTATKLTTGSFTFIEEGSTNATTSWVLSTPLPITLGSTALTFTQFGAGATYTNGNGLSLTGNIFAVTGTTNRIFVSGAGVDIAATYVGQSSITTLGTIATGVWNGTAIAVANGGTGATTAAAARTNLSAAGVYRTTFTSASLSSGILTVNHNLGAQICTWAIADNNNKAIGGVDDITFTSTTTLTVDLTSFAATMTGTWTVVVTG
jgi:hypothetical protein